MKRIFGIILTCSLAMTLAGCGSDSAVPGPQDAANIPEMTVTSNIVGMADTGNKTTLKVDLIKTGGPGDTNLYYYNDAGQRVVYENQEELCLPLEPVTYRGSAIFDLGDDVDDSLIDSSGAVVKIADSSGYFADEYILSATSLDGAWANGKYTYTLNAGDIEWNTWDYDTSADYNSDREWSIMGGDGNGVYVINLEVSGITYNGAELPPRTFPVTVYCYGRTCTDLALSTEFVPNTADPGFTSGLKAGDSVKWDWTTENFDALMDNKPYMNDNYTDYFSVVWPEGTDASAITADDVTVTLSSAYGEEYVLSTRTAYGEEEYSVFQHDGETVIAVTYQQWSWYPVFSRLDIQIDNGSLSAGTSYEIASVGAAMVQTGGGGVEIDRTVTCYNFYGVEDMTEENAIGDTSYTLTASIDGALQYYAEDSTGKGFLTPDKEKAWVGDITEYYNIAVRGNVVFVESREVTTEERTIDGTTYTFDQNLASRAFYNSAAVMVEKGAALVPGYNLTNAGVSKWAWTTRYQSGWTTYTAQPDGLPYADGSWWYGYKAGESNPAYDAELAANAANPGNDKSGPGGGPDGKGPDENDPDGDANVQPGAYTYSEVNPSNLAIDWVLTLNPDGSYTLSEDNTHVGHLTYEGGSWEQNGDTIVCGAMISGPAHYDWADPAGFSVKISGEGFTPVR